MIVNNSLVGVGTHFGLRLASSKEVEVKAFLFALKEAARTAFSEIPLHSDA